MKRLTHLIAFLALVGSLSCERDTNSPENLAYIEYLKDKSISGIHILGDTVYIQTWRKCDNCYVAPHWSFFPSITEWTQINGDTYKNYSLSDFSGVPVTDNKGIRYIGKGTTVYKLSGDNTYKPLISTGDYIFNKFTFDKDDNIWFCSEASGIAFWNKSELKIYNSQNTSLLSNIVYGLVIDKSNTVWVSLGPNGLLKITNGVWQVIPNTEIPNLGANAYLGSPLAVTEKSVWFDVSSSNKLSNIIRFENGNWIYESPDPGFYTRLNIDTKGTVWAISNHEGNGQFQSATLKYFSNNQWVDFDVSDIRHHIVTVNATDKKVYIGTVQGLVEKAR